MESIIQIDERYALAFGLHWQMLDPMRSRGSQLKEFRQENGARLIAAFKGHGQETVGYAKTLTLPKKLRTLSAAGQIATSKVFRGKTVLIFLEDKSHAGAETDVGVVGLINGNVVQDVWTKASGVEALRNKFREQCARAEIEFTTVGTAHTITAVDGRITWLDILPTASGKGLARFKRTQTVPVLVLRPDLPPWAMYTIITLGVLAVGYWFYDKHETEQARLRKLALQNKAPDPAQLYATEVTKLLTTPTLSAAQAIRELRVQLKDLDVQRAGWDLGNVTCTASGCNAVWTRRYGTYKEFTDRAPKEWGVIRLFNDGKKLEHALPIRFTTAALPPVNTWPTEREFILNQVSRWQLYSDINFKTELMPVALMAVPPSVQPDFAAALPSAVWSMKWNVKDTQWWMSDALLSLPANVTIDTVSISFGQAINFNVEGKVYVRK